MPALRPDHDYIKIWGYWNGPIERLVLRDGDFYQGLDLMQAYQEDLLSAAAMRRLIDRVHANLGAVGFEAPGLEPHHLLLSADPSGKFIVDGEGFIETRLCNFETLRRLPTARAMGA